MGTIKNLAGNGSTYKWANVIQMVEKVFKLFLNTTTHIYKSTSQ